MKRCENDSNIRIACARLYWVQRKTVKARKWLEIALEIKDNFTQSTGEKNGDLWANLYKLELEEGNTERMA